MREIVVVGAGRIGQTIADMLSVTGDYAVTLLDKSAEQLAQAEVAADVAKLQLDLADPGALERALAGAYAVLSAAPYTWTTRIAEAAAASGTHYLDLTEDVRSTRAVKSIAASASTAFIPQCGLAPGFVGIAAMGLAAEFDALSDVRMRVGALPETADNVLGYALTWSPDGVINEYCEPCEAIVAGKRVETAPLEDRIDLDILGRRYEAFNTSGGLGSMCEALEGRVDNLSYQTLRYPGHAAVMKLLLQGLKLASRRDLMRDVLEHALGPTARDVVVIHVEVTGTRNGRPHRAEYANAIGGGLVGNRRRTAIQRTTAAGICTVLDLLAAGQLPQAGFVAGETIPLPTFLANRFGDVYAPVAELSAQVA